MLHLQKLKNTTLTKINRKTLHIQKTKKTLHIQKTIKNITLIKNYNKHYTY